MRSPSALLLLLLTAAVGAGAQQVGQNKGPGDTQGFTLTVK